MPDIDREKFIKIDRELADEAFNEAYRLYPGSLGALIFIWTAIGLGIGKITDEDIKWAKNKINELDKSTETQENDDG